MILRENRYLVSHHQFLDFHSWPASDFFVFVFDVTRPQSVDFSNQGESISLFLKQRQKMSSFLKNNSFWEQHIHTILSSPWKEKNRTAFLPVCFFLGISPSSQTSLSSSTLQQVCISSNLNNQLLSWNNQLLSWNNQLLSWNNQLVLVDLLDPT